MKDNADRFTLVDLTKGEEISKVRVPRGKVQLYGFAAVTSIWSEL